MLIAGVLPCLIVITVSVYAQTPLQDFSRGNEQFTADLVKLQYKTAPDKALTCPLSAEIIFALVAEGANGETETELRRTLHISDKKDTRAAVKSLIPLLNQSGQDITLTLATKLYVDKQFKVKESYKEVAVNDYKSDVESVKFAENTKTAELINKWVEGKTNNKIQNLIKSDQINADTALVLVNTLYLKGKWVTPFPEQRTRKAAFYGLSNKVEDVDMMHSAENARYLFFHCGFLKAKFLEIPFKDSTVSMTFILPDAKDGLTNLEQNVELYLKPHNLTMQFVAVSLPKFSIKGEQNFKEILQKLGASTVFNKIKADLSGISDKERLFVDFAVQKTFINVTESGVEAAAATAVGLSPTSIVINSQVFNADHPFFFFIRENKSNTVLFVGRYR